MALLSQLLQPCTLETLWLESGGSRVFQALRSLLGGCAIPGLCVLNVSRGRPSHPRRGREKLLLAEADLKAASDEETKHVRDRGLAPHAQPHDQWIVDAQRRRWGATRTCLAGGQVGCSPGRTQTKGSREGQGFSGDGLGLCRGGGEAALFASPRSGAPVVPAAQGLRKQAAGNWLHARVPHRRTSSRGSSANCAECSGKRKPLLGRSCMS